MSPELSPPAASTPEALPLLGAADPAFLLPPADLSALPAGPCVRSTGGCCQSCVNAGAHDEAGPVDADASATPPA